MGRLFAIISLALVIAGPARAEIRATAEAYQAEIRNMMAAQEARWSSRSAKATLQAAFESGGVGPSQRYAESWSMWLWIDWGATSGLYSSAERRLNDWRYAVENGQADAARVEAMLERGMARLRRLHSWIQLWFEDDLENAVERGLWGDRADEVCCDGLYGYYLDRAEKSEDDSIAPDYGMIGNIQVFPAVPEGGGVPELPEPDLSDLERRAAEAFATGDAAAIRSYIRDAEALLVLSDDPALIELARVLRLLRERLEYAAAPVEGLLRRAEDLPEGPLRDAIFRQAQDALLDRVGHLSEILASSATSPEERESMRSALVANAKRLAQLADDARFKFYRPSGAARLFAGLSAASHALDAGRRGDVRGSELANVLQDAGDSFPGSISPVAPFSGPMGAVAAQVDDIRRGFNFAAEALDGVSDAIGGEPEGVARAQAAVRGLKEVLSPKRFFQSITRGFTDGVINNVPFARSLYDWAKS